MTAKMTAKQKHNLATSLPAPVRDLLTTAARLESLGCRLYDLPALGTTALQEAFTRGFLGRVADNRVSLTNKGHFYARLLTA